MKVFLILLSLIVTFKASHAEILPSIFYKTSLEKRQFCETKPSANTWFGLMKTHLENHPAIKNSRRLKKDVSRNLLVTWSYQEFLNLNLSHTEVEAKAVGMMGHFYSNASHHLGRLVRYSYWDRTQSFRDREQIKKEDRALISGGVLGRAVETVPGILSTRLMKHSLDLYYTLSWVLGSTMTCGAEATLELVENYQCGIFGRCEILPGLKGLALQLEAMEHLKDALKVIQKNKFSTQAQLKEFAQAFVVFEQFYLQHTMYNQVDIGASASLGILDRMRFIPFEGTKSLSFKQWCDDLNCQKSSADFPSRVLFDQTLLTQEIVETSTSLPKMALRRGHEMIRQVRRELLEVD